MRDPDLVIFDVDGTLHDTTAWWAPVIRSGLRSFAEQSGIPIEMPDDRTAQSVIGMKDAGVWAPFLPEEHKHRWQDLRAVVLPQEIDELRSGRDYLFPGVRDLLQHLRGLGVRLALASNCRSQYMAAIREGQGLEALTDWQFCLDSERVDSKTDMLIRAREEAGSQRPVMVGDREPDQEAAAALGIPFVWRRNDMCDLEGVSDAVWEGSPDHLLGHLGLPGIS